MKTKPVGYIVLQDEKPQQFTHYSDGSFLVNGRYASLFPTRPEAQRAIRVTNRYASKMRFNWPREYVIVSVMPEPLE